MYILLWLEVLFIEKIWTQFTEPFLIILPICVISRCSLGFLRSIKANMDCINFSAHHLLWLFAHKKAVTVSELSDYITRRKKNKNLNIWMRYKMVVLVLGYALFLPSFVSSKMIISRLEFLVHALSWCDIKKSIFLSMKKQTLKEEGSFLRKIEEFFLLA